MKTGLRSLQRVLALLAAALFAFALTGCGGSEDLDNCEYDPVRGVYVCAGGSSSSSSDTSAPATAETLYEAYQALRSGMTKAQVIALVPVSPSQGRDTSQVLWVDGNEALGVRFDGSDDTSVITYAEWGKDIPSGGQQENRSF